MKFLRGFVFGLIVGGGLAFFFAGTEPGRVYWSQAVDTVAGWVGGGADAGAEAARDASADRAPVRRS